MALFNRSPSPCSPSSLTICSWGKPSPLVPLASPSFTAQHQMAEKLVSMPGSCCTTPGSRDAFVSIDTAPLHRTSRMSPSPPQLTLVPPFIPTIAANDLPRQIWVSRNGEAPSPDKMQRVKNALLNELKPSGGFWSASSEGNQSSAWKAWILEEASLENLFGDLDRDDAVSTNPQTYEQRVLANATPFEIIPSADARIAFINDVWDAAWFARRYLRDSIFALNSIDIEALSQDFDALFVSSAGIMAAKKHLPAWDVESVFWFRWAFQEIRQLPKT